MKKVSLALISLLAAGNALAEKTVPFPSAPLGASNVPYATECTFVGHGLPDDTIVFAAGGYRGRDVDFQIDQSGNSAARFDVAVHSDKPVALLLGAYEPTIWWIGWTRGTKIVAVFVTGYHRQVVAGLPRNVPVIVTSYEPSGACGNDYLGSERGNGWVDAKSRSVFGKPVLRVYDKDIDGRFDIIESTRRKSAYRTSRLSTPESFRDKTAPLAGDAGLDEAMKKGALRRMTSQDLDTIREYYRARADRTATAAPPASGSFGSVAEEPDVSSIPLERAFVVLAPFRIPAGLYGAGRAYFLVPNGVAMPTGNPGHSVIIDLNHGPTCYGPMCRTN